MKYRQQFDPIVSAGPVPLFGSPPAAAPSEAHTASVFVTAATGTHEPVGRIGALPTMLERLRARYWRYEIDMTHHPVVLPFTFPAQEEALAFSAIVTLVWAVRDPVEVALHGVHDLKPLLWTFLDQTLRGVSRQFRVEEVQAAEAEMRSVLDKVAGEIGFGLRLPMLGVSLRVDQDTERYLSERVQTGRAGNLAGDRHDLARREAEYAEAKAGWQAQLERVRAEWQGRLEQAQAEHRRDLDAAEAQHTSLIEQAQATHRRELDAAQAAHAREIERLNTEHETQLKRQRLAFYRDALDGNHHDVVILQLLENPHDIGEFMRLLEAGPEKHYERAREVLKELLTNKLAHAADLEDLTQRTIGELQTALSVTRPRTTNVIAEGVHERELIERERHTDRVIQQTTT